MIKSRKSRNHLRKRKNNMELITQEIKDLGMNENRTQQLQAIFDPMFQTLNAFEDEYATFIQSVGDEITKEVCANAKELRLRIARVRIDTEKSRKNEKSEYLKAGKAIDGIANTLKFAVSEKETKLGEIEKHFENVERERIEFIRQHREEELTLYEVDPIPAALGEMSADVYEMLLNGVRSTHESLLAARKEAAEKEAARIKAEEEERQRVIEENKKLKADAEEQARLQKIEDEKRQVEQARLDDIRKREDEDRMAAEKKLADEREKERKIAEVKQAAIEAELQKERDDKKRIEDEQIAKDKADAEEKQRVIDAEIAEQKRLAKAGDSEKLLAFRKELVALSMPELTNKDTQEQLRSLLNQLASLCKGE